MKHVACGPAFSIAINEFGRDKILKYITMLLIILVILLIIINILIYNYLLIINVCCNRRCLFIWTNE